WLFHAVYIKLLAERMPCADAYIATWYPTALSVWLGAPESSRKLFFVQDFPELVREVDGAYGLRLFDAALRLPFTFLANSSYTRDLVLSRNAGARVYVSGVGVDTRVFYPRRSRMIDSEGKPVVMVIVRKAKFKGGNVAIRALNIVNKRIPVHAVLVSEGDAVKRVFQRVKPEFSYTVYSGVNDDFLARLYSSSEVFLFTSYRESFGLPPLEAMACGTAVVTTDCGGNRDYAVDGYNALVVPPGDPEAIARAVIRVLTDDELRGALAERGLETARRWTWERVVEVFDRALENAS
ncbi:glycosyltransferase family 4 protein, partial [Infirmifilum sp.]|uniref:glycosyltransferase family 4 protein n=1 Tax=Infirmifilum sp. TaxID=2856575 RepID=UPI003D0A2C20